MKFLTNCAKETVALGEKIGARLQKGDVVALQGGLGAGKTTLAKGIAHALGVEQTVTSPTFCLVSEYYGKMPLYHFDAYRLQGASDFADLGAEEMLFGNGVCLVEWSEKIMEELPKCTIIIKIKVKNQDSNFDFQTNVLSNSVSNSNQNLFQNKKSAKNEQISLEKSFLDFDEKPRMIIVENWPYEKIKSVFSSDFCDDFFTNSNVEASL